jgi:hypothetical protein
VPWEAHATWRLEVSRWAGRTPFVVVALRLHCLFAMSTLRTLSAALVNLYAVPMAKLVQAARNPMLERSCMAKVRWRFAMFEFLLIGAGFVVFCLFIVHERLSNRL